MIETLTSNPFLVILIFPVVTLTIFVTGIIKIDVQNYNKRDAEDEKNVLHSCLNLLYGSGKTRKII